MKTTTLQWLDLLKNRTTFDYLLSFAVYDSYAMHLHIDKHTSLHSLNMVIGANGTGKSTLLNAICLGLGGEPKLLGRADDLRAFIMHNKDKAEIELELAPPLDQNADGAVQHILKRIIYRDRGSEKGRGRGASTFFINNEKVKIEAIRELVSKTYNIQIDNLCTFLPQDKVGSFSGFSDPARLLETEKTLPGNLHDMHLQLIEKEAAMASDTNNLDSIRDDLKKAQHEFERCEISKQNEELRAKAVEQVDLLKKKRVWLEFEILRAQGVQRKEEKNQLKEKVKEAAEKIAPLEEKHLELESLKKKLQIMDKAVDQNIKMATKEGDKQRQKYESYDDEIESRFADLMEMDAKRAQDEQALVDARKKLEDLLESLNGMDKNQLEKEFHESREALKVLRKDLDAARRESRVVANTFAEMESKSAELQNKLAKMNDSSKQQREHVFRTFPALAKIYEWVDQNRDKFRRPVWGPVAVEVATQSSVTASYLEMHVPNNILKSFVVETDEDRHLLYSEIREKLKIPINIVSVRGKTLDQSRIYSQEKMNILKRDHGVQCYLDETFKAPDPVMIALQIYSSVNKVLVGGETTKDSLDNKGLKEFLGKPDGVLGQQGLQRSCIFVPEGNITCRHTQSKSKYTGKGGSRVDQVGRANLLAAGVDPQRITKTEGELKAVHIEISELRPSLLAAQTAVTTIEQQAQERNQEVSQKKIQLDSIQKYQGKIDRARLRVQECQANLEGDDTEEKKLLVKGILKQVKNSLNAIHAQGEQHDVFLCETAKHAGISVNWTTASTAERIARSVINMYVCQPSRNIRGTHIKLPCLIILMQSCSR